MNTENYFPGVVTADLKSGNYNVAIESNPDPLETAEMKFQAFIDESKRRGLAVGDIIKESKPNIMKEVMVIENDTLNFAFISDKYIGSIAPWEEQINKQMFTYSMMNQAQANNQSFLGKFITLAKDYPLISIIVALVVLGLIFN